MKVYKLTRADMTTHGGCKWKIGEPKETDGSGGLCTSGWLHAYEHPLLAVLHNPIHGNFDLSTARMFEGEAEGEILRDSQMKLGCTKLTLIREVEIPEVSMEQAVRYGILRIWELLRGQKEPWMVLWRRWARDWLRGVDTSREAAWAAAEAARAAAWAAAEAARAAWEAAWEARAAAAAEAAAWEARAAAAAEAAAWAAARAAESQEVDLVNLAEQAMRGAKR